MEKLLDIKEYMCLVNRNNRSLEEAFGCAIRNLHVVENYFAGKQNLALRNNTRATIAYLKLLYDYGQQMSLARMYLMHRIRIFEAREHDLGAEISVSRGVSSSPENRLPSPCGKNAQQKENYNSDQEKESDTELDIILDTRMIKEIDLSEAALRDISRRIEDKKNVLINIEQQMDDVFSLLITSEEQQESSMQGLRSELASGSSKVEWTQGFETPNHPRDGDTRILSPNMKTGYGKGHENKLTAAEVSESQRQAYQSYGPWGGYVFILSRACSLSTDGGGA